MATAPLLLSIDCGTQSLRALIFDTDGTLLAREQIVYMPYFSSRPGWAEQDTETFWTSLRKACHRLMDAYPDYFSAIAGIGVTTQRDSMVNVDADGNPLRPVITWLDQRKARPWFNPPPPISWALKGLNLQEAILKSQSDGKCNWIMQNEPDLWKRTRAYLQVSGFLNHRLTGAFKDSVASQIGHIPFDYKKQKWAGRNALSRRLFPIEPEKLPELVPPGGLIGHITEKASASTGLKTGIPVIACGSDKGCETIGMGVLDESMASLSFGTTATVQTTSRRYFEPLTFMPPYPAPIPGHYNTEVEIFRGYWMITWFKEEFAHKEVEEAATKRIAPEALMDRLLSEAPPGSMGLIAQPFWGPGLKEPAAKGALIGFGDVHKKAHVYRALIEGLAYGLRDGLEKTEKKSKSRVRCLAVSGGASQSDKICQISANIFNRPLVRGKTVDTSGLGAAIVTAVGIGVYPNFYQAIKNMVQYDRTFIPTPDHAALYDRLYTRVYQKMFKALNPLYETIRDITGYPEK